MITQDKTALLFAVRLAALAGFVDALGFLKVGGFFISFMSGNSTRFAVNAARLGWAPAAIMPVSLILLFVLGVMTGALIQRRFSRRSAPAVLAFVTLLLLLAAALGAAGLAPLSVALMVLAMGAVNNVFVRNGQVNIGVTYMTGTLVKFGQKLAAALLGAPIGESLPFLVLWLGLVSGAILGAFCYGWIGLGGLWIAAAFAGFLLLAARGLPPAPHQ